jgi:RIO-like serine/threonine protein kinase
VEGPPVTGRIGYEDSEEVKVVHGDPPELVEKRYLRQLEADRETTALEALAEAGFALAPRPVRRDGPLLATQTWLSGRALNVERLGDEELEAWILRAADVLAGLRRRTASGGEVLRHGDFWLGNLLVEGDTIVGVVDWTEATRGEPAADADHLVATLVESGRISAERGRDLRALVEARLGPA